jgi:signal transduction histidine kinase
VLIGAVQVGATAAASRNQPDARPFGWLACGLLVASAAALVARRWYPVAALIGTAAPIWVYLALHFSGGPVFLAMIGALVTAILAGRRVAAWVAVAIGYPLFVWGAPWAGGFPMPSVAEAAGIAAWLIALAVVVELARTRRERAVEFRRTRAEEARRLAGEQRMAIARELHDVLAHHISLISVQAGVALHLLDEQPEQARTALTAIKQASRESLGELRSVLELLRHGEEGAPRTPAPGLEALDALVARTSAAGVPVTVEVRGTPRPLPGGAGLAAYRIVQEALTNVTRHAGPATATILLGYGDRELTVQVTDDGPGADDTTGSGSGLLGMAERAAAVGGEVDAGPRPGGGFQVTARLPLPAATAPAATAPAATAPAATGPARTGRVLP